MKKPTTTELREWIEIYEERTRDDRERAETVTDETTKRRLRGRAVLWERLARAYRQVLADR